MADNVEMGAAAGGSTAKTISPIRVRLSEQQWMTGASIGLRRHVDGFKRSQVRGAADRSRDELLVIDIRAALGEMAFGMALGFYWPATVGNTREPDLLPNWQVKTADGRSFTGARLFVDDDMLKKPGDLFVLVTQEEWFVFDVHGWISTEEILAGSFESNLPNGPSKAVPQMALHPFRAERVMRMRAAWPMTAPNSVA